MCFSTCCASTCCTAIYYICLAAVFIYLVLCIALIPKYRYVAVMVIGIVALYATAAWRLLPTERQMVRRRAEALAGQRLAAAASVTVAVPRCATPTAPSTMAIYYEPSVPATRA